MLPDCILVESNLKVRCKVSRLWEDIVYSNIYWLLNIKCNLTGCPFGGKSEKLSLMFKDRQMLWTRFSFIAMIRYIVPVSRGLLHPWTTEERWWHEEPNFKIILFYFVYRNHALCIINENICSLFSTCCIITIYRTKY